MSSFDVESAIPVIETAYDKPLVSEDIPGKYDASLSCGAPFRAQLRDEFSGDVSIGINNGPATVEELMNMSGEHVPEDVSLDVRIQGTWYSDVESKANKFDRYAHDMELSTPASLNELEYPAMSASASVMEFLLSGSWLWNDFVLDMASPADLAYLCFPSGDDTPDFDKLEKVRITEVTGLPFTVLSNIPRLNLFSGEKAPKLRDLHLEGSVTSVFVPSFLSDTFENNELEKLTLLRLSSLSHMITPFQGYSFTKLTSLKIAFNCSIVAGALEAANLLSKLVLPALEELSIHCGNETALDKRDLKSLNALDHVIKQVIELVDRSGCGPFLHSLEIFAPSTSVMQPTGGTLSNLLEKTPNLQYLRLRTPSAVDFEKLCEKEKRKFKLVPHINRCIFDGDLTNETAPDQPEVLKADLYPSHKALSRFAMLRSRSSATPLHLCVNLDRPNSAREHQSGLLSAHSLAERQARHDLVTGYHTKLKEMLPIELSVYEGPRNVDEPDTRDDIQQVETALRALNKERNIPDPHYLSLLLAFSLPPPPSPPLPL
ncbi:hypothetical protein CPC08DRAFT_794244 [Agrocybe pediades]|nr:hypothetical protein CPC08DRAFT_794244 [Agrocybe pediades]